MLTSSSYNYAKSTFYLKNIITNEDAKLASVLTRLQVLIYKMRRNNLKRLKNCILS